MGILECREQPADQEALKALGMLDTSREELFDKAGRQLRRPSSHQLPVLILRWWFLVVLESFQKAPVVGGSRYNFFHLMAMFLLNIK